MSPIELSHSVMADSLQPPWTAACQAPLPMGFLISCIGRGILYHWVTWEALDVPYAAYHLPSASSHCPTWDAGIISSTYSTIITFDSREHCRNPGIRASLHASCFWLLQCGAGVNDTKWSSPLANVSGSSADGIPVSSRVFQLASQKF